MVYKMQQYLCYKLCFTKRKNTQNNKYNTITNPPREVNRNNNQLRNHEKWIDAKQHVSVILKTQKHQQ